MNCLHLFRKPTYYDAKTDTRLEIWKPITPSSGIQVLQMDKEIKMIELPLMERLRFWESLKLPDMVPWKNFDKLFH